MRLKTDCQFIGHHMRQLNCPRTFGHPLNLIEHQITESSSESSIRPGMNCAIMANIFIQPSLPLTAAVVHACRIQEGNLFDEVYLWKGW
ncbi:hypothetical protein CY34DRAFT_428881 [Suillus luteus UH-Slu-Lm8-n1]|uniref:Uncharacterized protein n=1 Tax=Suillus luteus UH-Slu-Lm8-n1 TaxID=930992 RepID=A0A0D0AI09_9AGAM|nr:hypothetical protein CY34DRAFT_428881 [Suillus luteus UH-Slu-Lm8-n1]